MHTFAEVEDVIESWSVSHFVQGKDWYVDVETGLIRFWFGDSQLCIICSGVVSMHHGSIRFGDNNNVRLVSKDWNTFQCVGRRPSEDHLICFALATSEIWYFTKQTYACLRYFIVKQSLYKIVFSVADICCQSSILEC